MGDDPSLTTFVFGVIIIASLSSILLPILAWNWPAQGPRRAVGLVLLLMGGFASLAAGFPGLLPVVAGVALLATKPSGSGRP